MPKKAVPTMTVMPKTKAVAKQILIVNVARDSTHGYSFIYLVYQSSAIKARRKIEVLSSAEGRDIKPPYALKGTIG